MVPESFGRPQLGLNFAKIVSESMKTDKIRTFANHHLMHRVRWKINEIRQETDQLVPESFETPQLSGNYAKIASESMKTEKHDLLKITTLGIGVGGKSLV